MKKLHVIYPLLLVLLALTYTGCDPDEPGPEEEEVITTLTLTFTNAATSAVTTATFKDPDGDGGNAPTQFDEIVLAANSTYNVAITLLNEAENPTENITEEIEEEDDEHFFCFEASGANVSITRTDTDGTYEVGLESRWETAATSEGKVKVILKHQPGVKNGTCAPGETDIEVDFVAKIQ